MPNPKKNHLLESLPEAEWRRLEPVLEEVDLPLGMVLYESGRRSATSISRRFDRLAAVRMKNGASAEIAVVGNEGIVGVSLFMGGETTPSRAIVQSAGQGLSTRPAAR